MTLVQAIEVSKAAKAAGYSTRVKAGLLQFVTVEYDKFGKSTVTPRTEYMNYDAAIAIIKRGLK